MIFHECDKCGERTAAKEHHKMTIQRLPEGKEYEFDLCGLCTQALQSWSKKSAKKKPKEIADARLIEGT